MPKPPSPVRCNRAATATVLLRMCEQPRLFLPLETLEKLICSECKEYLRCGPVKVKLDGESVCGKCCESPQHSAPLVHHRAFEEIVRLVCFPCKYRELGCPQYIYFDDATNHEEACVFRSYYCPTDFLSCTWTGTASQLPEHYRRGHRELYLSDTTFAMNLSEDAQETRLYVQERLSFLVKVKVSKEDGKFWIKIEHLEETSFLTPINYKLILHTTEEDGLRMVMKERPTSHATFSSVFDVADAHCVDINSLLTILENPVNVYCTVDLKLPAELIKDVQTKLEEVKCPHCSSHMAPPIFMCTEGHTSCEDCVGYNKKCKECNKENAVFNRHTTLEVISATNQLPCRWPSCTENLDYSAIRRHEKTCQHKRHKCPRCYNWHGIREKLCDHFFKEHETHPLHLAESVVIEGTTKVYDFYVMAYGDVFGCSLFPTNENGKNFSVWYYGLPTFYDKYEYYVQMRKKGDGKSEDVATYQLEKCCATENCFSFNLKIPNDDIEKCDHLDAIDFVFEIVEKP